MLVACIGKTRAESEEWVRLASPAKPPQAAGRLASPAAGSSAGVPLTAPLATPVSLASSAPGATAATPKLPLTLSARKVRRLQKEKRGLLTKTVDPKPETRNPKPEARNSKPETRNPKPETRNPHPYTLNLECTPYRGASPIGKPLSLGPHIRPMPWVLGGS